MDELEKLKADLAKFEARDRVNEATIYPDAETMLRSLLKDVRRIYGDLAIMDMVDVRYELGELIQEYSSAQVRGR